MSLFSTSMSFIFEGSDPRACFEGEGDPTPPPPSSQSGGAVGVEERRRSGGWVRPPRWLSRICFPRPGPNQLPQTHRIVERCGCFF